MFTKEGIELLHSGTHQSLDILLDHVSSVPVERLREEVAGFGFPTVWKQLLHVLEVERGWISNLQNKPWVALAEDGCPGMDALRMRKREIRDGTRAYLRSLSEQELNQALPYRPEAWSGELRNPAFIFLHVATHTFHHKGQVVAMLRILGHPAPDTDLQRN